MILFLFNNKKSSFDSDAVLLMQIGKVVDEDLSEQGV